MAEKHCATCRFFGARMGVEVWDDDHDNGWGAGDVRETEHHPCSRIIHGNGGLPTQHHAYDNPFPFVNAEPAIVTDGSGYAARLRVLPSFGCVLHESHESSKRQDT